MALFNKMTMGIKNGPKPARISIEIPYDEEKWGFLRGLHGFRAVPDSPSVWVKILSTLVMGSWKPFAENIESDIQFIHFEIPVTPPTVSIDFGNSKDTENVTRLGEVVLPKYKKATQYRWESFFPYDMSAPYLKTKTGIMGTFSQISNAVTQIGDNFSQLLGNESRVPTPEVYNRIFKILSNMEIPFSIAMSFYEGGDIESTWVTLDSFQSEPESNGDYKYSISLVEWVDITPAEVDKTGKPVTAPKLPLPKTNINKFGQFLNKWTQFSNLLTSVIKLYAGLKTLFSFNAPLFMMNLRDTTTCATKKIGVPANMFGKSKITVNDAKFVSESLKKLSFTKSSQHLYDLINNYKMNRS